MRSRDCDWGVVGGGLGAAVSALALRRAGHRVTLCVPGPALGGAVSGHAWNGFELDHGCHLFPNDGDAPTGWLRALAGGTLHEVAARPASVLDGRLCRDGELPDLRPMAHVLPELIDAAAGEAERADEDAAATLPAWLDARYGPSCAAALTKIAAKLFACDPSQLAAEARHPGPFRRVRLHDGAGAELLKTLPALDDRLAIPGRRPAARSLYPRSGGLRSLQHRITDTLADAGVELRFGCEVEAVDAGASLELGFADGGALGCQRVLWAAGLARLEPALSGRRTLAERIHGVPMALYWYDLAEHQQGPHDWIHLYDEDVPAYRVSFPGRYANDVAPEGRTIACVEVPTTGDSDIDADPEGHAPAIFETLRERGIVTGPEPRDVRVRRLGSSYRVPRAGFREAALSVAERAARTPALVLPAEWRFGVTAAIAACLDVIDVPARAA